MDSIVYRYQFLFSDNTKKIFIVELDPKSLELTHSLEGEYPDWARLASNKCSICPLSEAENDFCPTAAYMVELIHFLKELISYQEVDVIVDCQERRYQKHLPLQMGASSLLGIYMVASGCPILAKLKPMLRFHLPFASIEETTYRALSMYLLSQYFVQKQGGKPDWEMKDLSLIYENIARVNCDFCHRLRSLSVHDAGLNAIVILDMFANSVKFSIDSNKTDKIKSFFQAYL